MIRGTTNVKKVEGVRSSCGSSGSHFLSIEIRWRRKKEEEGIVTC